MFHVKQKGENMAGFRVSYNIKEPVTMRKTTVVATGDTAAHALSWANAKAKVTTGTFVNGSKSEATTAVPTLAAGNEFSDAVIVLAKGSNTVSIRIENISLAYASGVNGLIDVENADIKALATNYFDPAGVGEYLITAAYFTK